MLLKGAMDFGITLDEEKLLKFEKFKELLLLANEKMNLTAITDSDEIDVKHFLDSLSIFNTNLLKDDVKLIDVGAGAGFPSIPLKIANSNLSITMLDSLNKRINFLNDVIEKIDLKDISAFHMRAEDGGKDERFREKFDIATARAVANLASLSEYCLPFVKVGGYFISMKGKNVNEEVKDAKNAIKILGGKLEEVLEVPLNFKGEVMSHYLVIVKKIQQTPAKYPRKAPHPTNKPLINIKL